MIKLDNFQKDILKSTQQNENLSKQTKLIKFIESISKEIIAESDIEKKIAEIFEIYKDNTFRHSYADISQFLINLVKQDKEEKFENLSIITSNIEKIIEAIQKDDNNKNKDEIKKIFKLKDHIDLEIIRHEYISKKYGSDIKKIETETSNLNREAEKLKTETSNLNREAEKLNKNLEISKTNHVAIFGIFSAIIISFTSGIGFSNQILSNIGKFDFSILLMIISVIAIFIGTIIFSLFWFILKLNNKKFSFKAPFFAFVIFFIIIFVGSAIYYTCNNIANKTIEKPLAIDINITR